METIIRGSLVYDGSGAPAKQADVIVADGKILAVGENLPTTGRRVIEAKGLSLAPGFIDCHTHSDYSILVDPAAEHVMKQGVTTQIGGQCGYSRSPVLPEISQETKDYFDDTMMPDVGVKTPSFATYSEQVAYLRQLPLGVNQTYFTGHRVLRGSVMGLDARHATDAEIKQMELLLAETLENGAQGLSSGMSYGSANRCSPEELVRLGRVVSRYGGMYTSHIRSEAAGLMDAIEEAVRVGREAGISVNISHMKVVGSQYWSLCSDALALIDRASKEGVSIYFDAYPYTASCCTTMAGIPSTYTNEGAQVLADKLYDPTFVQRLYDDIFVHPEDGWDNPVKNLGLDKFFVTDASATPDAEGKTIVETAELWKVSPFEAFIRIIRDNRCQVTDCRFSMCEENLEEILRHPLCGVCSDAIYLPGCRYVHPRAMAAFPRFLGRYVRDRALMSREEGIYRITGLPAKRYKLHGKGLIRAGMDADLVLFDYDTILDYADYSNPFRPNHGISMVMIGGQVVVENGACTGVRNGKIISRGN